MFNSGNSTPFSMPVAPIGYGGMGGGMSGWGNDWIALAILAMIFGGNGFGFGGWGGGLGMMEMFLPFMFGGFNGFGGWSGNGSGSVQGEIQRGFDNQSVLNKLNGIEQGICSLGYDNLAQINNLGMAVANGFHGVDNAICNLGYTTQQGFNATQVAMLQGQNALQAQLAQCCCDNRVGQMQLGNLMERGFCDINYNAVTNTNAIIQNSHNDTDRVLARLDAMEMSRKDEIIAAQNQRIFGLELSASQANQNAVLMASMDANKAEILRKTGAECPTAAYIVQPPQPVTFPTNCCGGVNYAGYGNGYNNGCGCGNNSGCGCC